MVTLPLRVRDYTRSVTPPSGFMVATTIRSNWPVDKGNNERKFQMTKIIASAVTAMVVVAGLAVFWMPVLFQTADGGGM